jgi:tRNA pseudouridine13 synthase
MTEFAWGGPPVTGRLRERPEDFRVTECLGHTPDGDGEHLWLWIEKRERNTTDVADALARAAGVHPRQVSFAGLKDRNAVTGQYFSIHLPGNDDPPWEDWRIDGVEILEARRSSRKIRRGRLTGNRFEIRVRGLQGDRDVLIERLQQVRAHGVPNGFGEQRFGGNNIARAHALFAGKLRRKPSKHKRGFYLSAARSLIFNQVLARRIEAHTWNRLVSGDVAMLEGSSSWFFPEADDSELGERCERLDIHPTGPLVGLGESPVSGQVADLEQAMFEQQHELVEGLCKFRLKHERRALRMKVSQLEWTWPDPQTLSLSFKLGQGCYATSVLRELIIDLVS